MRVEAPTTESIITTAPAAGLAQNLTLSLDLGAVQPTVELHDEGVTLAASQEDVLYQHTLTDGTRVEGTLEYAMKVCPVLGKMSTEKAQETLATSDVASRIAEQGRARRLAAEEAAKKASAKTAEASAKKPEAPNWLNKNKTKASTTLSPAAEAASAETAITITPKIAPEERKTTVSDTIHAETPPEPKNEPILIQPSTPSLAPPHTVGPREPHPSEIIAQQVRKATETTTEEQTILPALAEETSVQPLPPEQGTIELQTKTFQPAAETSAAHGLLPPEAAITPISITSEEVASESHTTIDAELALPEPSQTMYEDTLTKIVPDENIATAYWETPAVEPMTAKDELMSDRANGEAEAWDPPAALLFEEDTPPSPERNQFVAFIAEKTAFKEAGAETPPTNIASVQEQATPDQPAEETLAIVAGMLETKNDHPVEAVLAEPTALTPETVEEGDEVAGIQKLSIELAEAFEQQAISPNFENFELTPETAQELTELFRLIGYEKPEQALTDLIVRRDLSFVVHTVVHLAHLSRKHRPELRIRGSSGTVPVTQALVLHAGSALLLLAQRDTSTRKNLFDRFVAPAALPITLQPNPAFAAA